MTEDLASIARPAALVLSVPSNNRLFSLNVVDLSALI